MKLRKLILPATLITTISLIAVSCTKTEEKKAEPAKETTPEDKKPDKTTPVTNPNQETIDKLTQVAKEMKFKYNGDFFTKSAADVAKEKDAAEITASNLDETKYSYKIESYTPDDDEGSITLKVKVSLKDGSASSNEVSYTIYGFKTEFLKFIPSQYDTLLEALKKPTVNAVLNLSTLDLVIPKEGKTVDLSKPDTFTVVAKYNSKVVSGVTKYIDQFFKDISANLPKLPDGSGTEAINKIKNSSFDFNLFKDLWDKKEGAVDKFFNNEVIKLLLSMSSTTPPQGTPIFGFSVPTGVDLKSEVQKLFGKVNNEFGFIRSTFVVPAKDDTSIDFTKKDTYKAILNLPSKEQLFPQFSGLITSLTQETNEKLKEIKLALIKKSAGKILFKRTGNTSLSITFS